MQLSELSIDEIIATIPLGLKVISAINTPGVVTDVWYQTNYHPDDLEKNPIIEIQWDNGNTSSQPWFFMNKVSIDK